LEKPLAWAAKLKDEVGATSGPEDRAAPAAMITAAALAERWVDR
jgi:hypothetical protein